MRRFLVCLMLVLCATVVFAQQDYVARYDAFGSYSYLTSPKMNLTQRGFNGQFGINMRRWVAMGVDYSIFKGHSSLVLSELDTGPSTNIPVPVLMALGGLPPGFSMPYDATTWSFAAGPQFNLRKFKYVTFFAHPDLGVMHESVTAKADPGSPYYAAQLGALALLENPAYAVLSPSGAKTDTAMFWGGAGGFDLNVSKHVHIRAAVDVVHVFLFKGFLAEPRNAVRLSVGPTFDFGRNVK